MEKLNDTLMDRMGSLVLLLTILVAVCVGLLLPPTAVADSDVMALDRGRYGGHDSGEGDPLDGNEPDGDLSDGQDVHDTVGKLDSGQDFFRRFMMSTRVLLVPQYNGSLLTFRIIFLAEAVDVVEQGYAK